MRGRWTWRGRSLGARVCVRVRAEEREWKRAGTAEGNGGTRRGEKGDKERAE